jgi:hypothetical protein
MMLSEATDLRKIDAQLEGAPFLISSDQTRILIKKGDLLKHEPLTGIWVRRTFFLFNDLLLWTKAKSKTVLEYRGHMNLNGWLTVWWLLVSRSSVRCQARC